MLLTRCKTDVLNSSVINFACTPVLVEEINELICSESLHIEASSILNFQAQKLSHIKAFIFEVNSPDATNGTIELLKKIRQTNQGACTFVLTTHSKSLSSTNFYISGADHFLKLPNIPSERKLYLSKALKESHWKKPVKLYLDSTRLLLCSDTDKLELSYTEMTIIDALLMAPEHVMSQDEIAKTLDPKIIFYDPRALEKTISRLRTKIKKIYELELILSIRAYGYRLRRGSVEK